MKHHAFGTRSEACLATVDPRLAHLCREVLNISPFDLAVVCGRRSKEDQERAVREGRSKVHWPHGNHNTEHPGDRARAVDVCPVPVDWTDKRRFYIMGGLFLAVADRLGIRIRWGGDWNGNGILTDQRFDDLPHIELRGP